MLFKTPQRSERKYPSNSFLDYLTASTLLSDSIPNVLQYLFLLSSNVQVLAILLWGQLELVVDTSENPFLQNLLKLFQLLVVRNPIGSYSILTIASPFIIGAWLYFLLFFLAFGVLVKNFYTKKKNSKIETVFLPALGQFHLAIGFWIIHTSLLDILSTNYLTLEEGTIHLCTGLIALTLIIINFVICAFYSLFAYNPFIQSNQLSVHTPVLQLELFIFKVIIALTVTLTHQPEVAGWAFTVCSFCMLGYQHYTLVSTFPFFEYRPMKVAVVFSSLFLSVSGTSLLAYAVNARNSLFVFAMEGFLVAMATQIILNHFNIIIKKYLIIDTYKLNSEKEVVKKIFALRYLFGKVKVTLCSNKTATPNEVKFWGIWSSLVKDKALGGLKTGNLNEGSMTEGFRKYFSISEQTIITIILKDATRKLKRSDKLKIMLCNLSLEHDEQVSTGMYYLTALSKPQGLNRIVVLKLHQKVQQKVYSFFNGDLGQEKTLDLKSYMDLESVSVNFLQMIYMNARKYITFWEKYKKAGTKLKELYRTHLEIEKNSDNILRFWKTHIESNRVFASSLNTIYSIYLALVRNSPSLGRKTLELYNSFNIQSFRKYDQVGPLSQDNLSSPNNITFYASMAKERVGRILYVSPNITELLGWTQEGLKGVNVSMIVPSFMQKRHDVALLEHLEKASTGVASPRLYKNLMTYVTDKAGYKVPCYVYLSLYPYIQGELIYTAIVRLRRSETNVILINEDGDIEGFTKDVADRFKLEPNKKVKIRDICENYKVLERALNNLSKLIGQQTAANLQKKKRDQLSGLVNVHEEVMEEFSGNLYQNIKVKFYLPGGEGRQISHSGSKVFSVHITPRKFWESYYFILRLEENYSKEVRRNSGFNVVQSPGLEQELSPDVPVERIRNYAESYFGSTQMGSTMIGTSNGLLKTAITTTYMQKVQSPHKKKKLFMSKNSSKSDVSQSIEIEGVQEDDKSSVTVGLRQHQHDKKGQKEKKGIYEVFNVNNKNPKSSASMIAKYNAKLEEAVHRVPRDIGFNMGKLLSIVFILTTSATLVLFTVKNGKMLSFGEENATVINRSLMMLGDICDLNKAMKLFRIFSSDAYNMTYDNRSRYGDVGLNISTLGNLENIISNKTNELSQANKFLRLFIYKIDPEIQTQLFENQIPIYEAGSNGKTGLTRYTNIFDLTTQIVVNAIKITSKKMAEASQAISFILDNSLNDVLRFGEEISSMLIRNNKLTLHEFYYFSVYVLISMGVFSIFLVCLNICFIRTFNRKKEQLINIFRTLDIGHIENQISWVSKFASILDDNSMDSKKVNIKLEKEHLSNLHRQNNYSKNFKKSFDARGTNGIFIRFLLGKTLLILLMFSAYIVVFCCTQKYTKVLETDVNLVMTSSSYLYRLSLLSTIVYDYVDQNATSQVRNHPIRDEWDSIVANILQAQSFLMSTFLENDEADHIPVYLMLKGNLCDEIGLKDYESSLFCNNIGGGVLQKGLVGLVSYVQDTLSTVKSSFDEHWDQVNILDMKSLVVLEAIMNMYGPMVNKELAVRIENYTKSHYENADKTIKNIVIIYIVLSLISGGIFSRLIEKKFRQEVVGWRKIIRQVPYEIISTNKLLKNYLVHNSDGILNGMRKSFE